MTGLPRAVCPTCQREVAVRRGGELREHRDESGELCVASGHTVAEVERRIEAEVDAIRGFAR